jgi:ribosomal-protein-alanine N-acetyltransferase
MVQVNKVPPIYLHDKEAYVCEIIVEDDYRGKGIGTSLLEEVEAWARKKKMYSIGLTVHIANPEALSVYSEFGLKEHHLKMAKIVK